jgi:uncharacterized protein YbjT (DUF2867 family)
MKILLTGANGYIGKRLLPTLLEHGHEVIAAVRNRQRLQIPKHVAQKVQIIEVDLLKRETLEEIPRDIEIAFYLAHSMSREKHNFADLEKLCAQNFVQRISKTQVKQIIYLSGLLNEESLSPHLLSRKNVEDTLKTSNVPVTTFRAGIIIGAGSASFEIIRDLVEKLPIMVAPKWISHLCQPIAIYDVIDYLTQAIDHKELFGKTFDIGGPDILSYKEMLLGFAKIRKLHRLIVTVPVLTPKLSSYWLYFVTSTNYALASSLVESLRSNAICTEHAIQEILPKNCLSYEESVRRAFSKIEENAVISSWTDSWASSELNADFQEYIQVPKNGCVSNQQNILFKKNPEKVLGKIWSIGGRQGWYYMNWAWKMRGVIDKLVGGVGLRRGRRDQTNLQPGDALDFWRVLLADPNDRRLLLYAEMKLPGEAWLEFKIIKKQDGYILQQTATFRPHGVWGRIYWYASFPFHVFLFRGLAKKIAQDKSE